MFCSKCGNENANDAKFCSSCGANIGTVEEVKNVTPSVSTTGGSMSFGTAIATCFSKFFNFSGRASRSEFWWFYLFAILLIWASALLENSGVLLLILTLLLFFPVIAAGSRRLHDANRSGWWQLLMLMLIPLFIGMVRISSYPSIVIDRGEVIWEIYFMALPIVILPILLVFLLASKGSNQENEYEKSV